jgi:hypothetical protein
VLQAYEDEITKMTSNKYVKGWNFCSFFAVKESLAFVYSQIRLPQEALRCYNEIEQTFLLLARTPEAFNSVAQAVAANNGKRGVPDMRRWLEAMKTAS